MNKTEQLLSDAKDILRELVIMHSHCALISMAQTSKDERKEEHTQKLVDKAQEFLDKCEKRVVGYEVIARLKKSQMNENGNFVYTIRNKRGITDKEYIQARALRMEDAISLFNTDEISELNIRSL